ncbi:hypothetical protein ACHHYP_05895, partial [Achlya hypogyna]
MAMAPPRTREILTDFEFNVALLLSVLSYTSREAGMSYSDFKSKAYTDYQGHLSRLGLNTRAHEPFIDFDDEKIRSITTSIGSVVYICITGSSTASDHASNFAMAATNIVVNHADADAPAGYNYGARNLGIANLAQELLRNSMVEKVVLCGHSRGGSIAHVVHYSLLLNATCSRASKDKVTSVAFGSTPFLKSQAPNAEFQDRFLSFYTDTDIVPALFAASTPMLQRLLALHGTKLGLLQLVTGINVEAAVEVTVKHLGMVLPEYLYYGNWVRLYTVERDHLDENTFFDPVEYLHTEKTMPTEYYTGEAFKTRVRAITSLDDVIKEHGVASAYAPYYRGDAVTPKLTNAEQQKSIILSSKVTLAAAQYLGTVGMVKESLAVRLNRAITAAVVTKTFGDDRICEAFVAVAAAVEAYLDTGLALLKPAATNNTEVTAYAKVAQQLEACMQALNDLLKRLGNLKPSEELKGDMEALHTFNESNIG